MEERNQIHHKINRDEKQKKQKKISEIKTRTHRKRARAPRTPAAHLTHIPQDGERRLVAERHVDDAVVRDRAHRRNHGALLSAAERRRADEEAGIFAPKGALLPQRARSVPEGLPLAWEVAVARRHAEEEGVVLLELGRVVKGGDAVVLGGRVHLLEDFGRQGFGDSVGRGQISCGSVGYG